MMMLMMDSGDKRYKSSKSSYKVSRKRNPLSSYTDSAVNHRVPILNDNKSIPLSLYSDSAVNHRVPILKDNKPIELSSYNITAVYQGGESKMDIFLVDECFLPDDVKYLKKHPIGFYFYRDPTVSSPDLRINYIQVPTVVSKSSESPSSKSKSDSTSSSGSPSSESKSDSTFSFGSTSSESKSEPKIIFGSFGSQSSESKVMESSKSMSSRNPLPDEVAFPILSKIIFGSFGSHSSESKVIESSKSKVSRNPIPDKVAFSILSKLPIKSLKRFGCIRKSWSVLFENSDFMTMYGKHFMSRHGSDDDYHTSIFTNNRSDDDYHTSIFTNNPSDDCFYLPENILKLNLPSPLQRDGYNPYTSILTSTSVNGIFCIGQVLRGNSPSYVLWNPLTEEFNEVPPSPAGLTPRQSMEHFFFFDYLFHGFGYDQLRDDFKVFQYAIYMDSAFYSMRSGFFEIYSSKSNSWRMISMNKDLCLGVEYNSSASLPFTGREVYVDGACHWLFSKYNVTININVMHLLSFNLSDEVFLRTPIGEEPLPPYDTNHRLTVLNGSIALILNYHDDIVFHISILGELGVSESWIKLYAYVPLPSIIWPPIGFGKMGYMFFRKEDHQLAYIDLSTQVIAEVGIRVGWRALVGLHKESLCSIGGWRIKLSRRQKRTSLKTKI